MIRAIPIAGILVEIGKGETAETVEIGKAETVATETAETVQTEKGKTAALSVTVEMVEKQHQQ